MSPDLDAALTEQSRCHDRLMRVMARVPYDQSPTDRAAIAYAIATAVVDAVREKEAGRQAINSPTMYHIKHTQDYMARLANYYRRLLQMRETRWRAAGR